MSEQKDVKTDVNTIKGWFAGRLPDGWFTGVEVTLEGDQIVVLGRLPEAALAADASAEEKAGAASGRIARFREETRGRRIAIAREAESRFDKFVTWGAAIGDTGERFTAGGSGRGEGAKARSVMIGWRGHRHGAWGHGAMFGPWMFANPWMRRRWQRRRQQREEAGTEVATHRPDQQVF